MDNIIDSISEFIGNIVAFAVFSSSVLLLAGEIRLATLRKASLGSTRLSAFTERMTSTGPMQKGGLRGTSKKSH